MKQFLSINDVANLENLVKEALVLKKAPFSNNALGKNKTLALLFFNASLRTRLSTQRAATNLGMNVIVMDMSKDGWQIEFNDGTRMDGNTQEHIKEAAAVISQYADIIGIRTFPTLVDKAQDYSERLLTNFIANASVPVISLESATLHPLQSLADLITIEEHKKSKSPKVVLTWAPHPRALPQAVANSFAEWLGQSSYDLVITHPRGYELNESYTKNATIEYDQEAAFANADFIYAKNWSSYTDYGKIIEVGQNWIITKDKMALTNNGKFMHCLPVRRNVVVSDEVLDGDSSIVIAQAANRIYSAQTVLKKILES